MIDNIIRFSVKNKLIIGLMTIALTGAGVWAMLNVQLGAVPDITNNQVQVITTAPNLSTIDIEQFVTYPVELAMANLPGVREIRSVSRFGLSVVTIIFEDDMGTYLPRQLVSNKLSEVEDQIPEGFGEPFMGPITTGLGEIYQYTIDPKPGYESEYTAMELRTIQDWIVKRQMALVPGVVVVNSFGGYIKQYEVAVDPDQLNSMDVTILDIYRALEANNQNTGGAYIERNHQAQFIRGEGLIRSLEDIENIVVKTVNNIPVTIGDVAEVQIGSAVRYGAFTKDGEGEAVGGIVMMLKGANSDKVIGRVKERMKQIEQSLPEGLEINAFLDRSELIGRTTGTIATNLIEGALIVLFVVVLLLGHLRGGLITASIIPLSLLFAFVLMKVFGVWANLMSLGAIDFGIIIDGAVIIVESVVYNVHQRLSAGGLPAFTQQKMDEITIQSSSKMMNAAFFGQVIILIVFTPLLALQGVEGKMFKPMAYTFGFAVLGAIILCLTYVPAVSALFLKPREENGKFSSAVERISDKLMNGIQRIYTPVLHWSLGRGKTVIIGSAVLLASALFIFTRMGAVFIPQLDEGDIAFHAIMKSGTALSETIETSTKIEKIILNNFPEAEHVLGRIGVSEVPTDPMPMDIADMFVILKPGDEWVSADSKEELISKIREKISIIPGVNYEFTQPIEMRFNELLSGVREDIAVKLFGEDLDILAAKAEEMGEIIAPVPGVGGMRVAATTGLPQMTVTYDRAKVAQYGLTIEKLNRIVSAAFAGGHAGVVFEGERRFDLVVRLDKEHRQSIEDLKKMFVELPGGGQIPMSVVADIKYSTGPMQISRDNTKRRTYVGINVQGRDVKSFVQEIQQRLDAQLELPPGYYIEYGGAFENLQRATQRLTLVVPLALALIFILLYFALRSIAQSMMIYMAIPLAAIGGIFALWVRGLPFSISAGVGFVVLFGVAVLNGLVLINRFNDLKEEDVSLRERIFTGADERLRPILLTALAAIFGFLPMAISTSAGAEVQRPLATVVIGGLFTSTLLTLLVLPVLYQWLERRKQNPSSGSSMKSLVLLLAFSGFTLTSVSNVQAQDSLQQEPPVLSLEEALNAAEANYPAITTAGLNVEQQQALKKTAWQLGQTKLFTGKEEVGNGQPGIRTVLGIQQQDIDLFGSFSRSKWRNEQVGLSKANRKIIRLEVLKRTASAYYDASFAKSRLQIIRRLAGIYENFEDVARLRYETEEISRLEFLTARSRYQEIKLSVQQATDDYRIALLALNRWTMLPDSFQVVSQRQLEVEAQPVVDMAIVVGHTPLLEPLRQEVDVQQARIGVEKTDLLPTFSIEYGWQEIGIQKGFHSWQIGISIPLWFLPEQGEIQAAKIRKDMAESRLYQRTVELKSDYNRLVEQLQKVRRTIHYYREQALPLSKEQLSAAQKNYRYGEISYVDFIQLTDKAIQTQINYLEYLNKYYQTANDIRFVLGRF